jgi:hypothetical protein
MLEELSLEDYMMKDVGGDGNCLFRSVSDQLYGIISTIKVPSSTTKKLEDYALNISQMKRSSSRTSSRRTSMNM